MSVSPSSNNVFSNYVKNQMNVQSAKKTENTAKTTELSSNAKEYLKKLKEKFGNVDFIVADYSSDEEAAQKLQSGKGEYNCVITPDLLEKMAADENVAKQYEGVITDATGEIDGLKETVKEKGLDADVKNYGVSVDGDGKVNYYVLLKDGLSKLNANTKTEGNDSAGGKKGTSMISASSIDELLKKLEEHQSGKSGLSVNSKHGDGYENKEKNEDSGVYKNIKKHVYDKSGKKDIMDKLLSEMQKPAENKHNSVHGENKAYGRYGKQKSFGNTGFSNKA